MSKKKKPLTTSVRTSGRVKKLSEAFRIVDEETRRQVHQARLDSLEDENYEEKQDDDDAFNIREELASDDDYIDESKKKAQKLGKKRKAQTPTRPGKKREKKTLATVLMEGGYESYPPGIPNYLSIAASRSKFPPRQLCSVCGFISAYHCVRCGMRYCCIRCQNVHRETRCLKFAD
eukprot:GILK01007437.1.p1 GENE.GILK01007437.1~~GILK01007437.1.p1  ORF type:complete len:186 (-),score=17.46 GILK01007437.1:154-681(-)